ncbi:MAG: aminoglycoside phosphotransferase family protein [Casimicrobiaceae bacterium]
MTAGTAVSAGIACAPDRVGENAVEAGQTSELVAALRRMQLLAPDETPALVALAGGVSSLIALARTARGPVCIKRALPKLRVEADWFAPVERNRAEVAWLRIAGDVVPGVVPRVLGEDATAMAFAMEWLDPQSYPVWKTLLRDGVADSSTADAVGSALAAIHATTANDADLARTFAHDASFYALRLEPYLEASARAHPAHAAALRALIAVTAATKRVLVHGDVSPKNILVGPSGPIFLDAECAWYGDPAFDLAFCLNHLLLKCQWRPALAGAYLACFDGLADAYLERVDWEPRGSIDERTARLLPGLMLARVDGKSPVEYLTAPEDRERVRQFALRHLEQPVAGLADLRARWAQDTGA